jgi:predicted ATPase/DNA-binding SARP family transcriptional activator
VDFRLLGPFEVASDGQDLTPTRRKQQLLLVALALRANRVVPTDDLIDILWGPSPPRTAHKALQGHVSALRKRLGAAVIESRQPGYLLHTEAGSIDVDRFLALIEAAREEGDPTRRRELLRSALALFRGEPLADFRYEPFAREETARLELLRLTALEDRLEADLQLGLHAASVPELEQLIAEQPHEERLRRLLMLALYRSGRQAQALKEYTEWRRRLVEDLGLEPSPGMQQLERQILNQDPGLELPSAPAGSDGAPSKLPLSLTQLIGRERELAEIQSVLARTRLLTLTGTAGTGKTRLAIEAAARASSRFHGDVFFVGLAPLHDPELVLPAIARTLEIKDTGGHTLVETLATALAGKDGVLVVLDNCEHLLDFTPSLAQLLAATPKLTLLATSREPLHLAGERVYPVPPLRSEEAVPLFAERVEAVKPDFRLTPTNEPVVIEICRRLDGLPLAIELAAARISLFPLPALLDRLDERLKLLTTGGRDQPARHQTLRAAIDWSYDLLSEHDRVLLAQVSVFAGGWTLEAAEAVCNGGLEIVDGLASLIDKNLVQLGGTEQEPRFTMLETIREYARERLTQSDVEQLRDRHLAWAVDFAERADPELRGPEQRLWLERLQPELDNFRAAFHWSTSRGDADRALRLGASLLEFWMVRADWSEGRRWVERALALSGAKDAPARTQALRAAAELADALSDYPASIAYYEESLVLARSTHDNRGMAEALFGLSFAAERVGNYGESRRLMEESVTILRGLGDEPSLARSLGGLAWLENDFRRARRLWSETLAIRRRLANRESVAWTLIQIGFCAQVEGDYAAARAAYNEALSIAQELDYERMVARSLTQLGELALLEGDVAAAKMLLEQTVPSWRRIGHRSGLVDALRGLGYAATLDRDFAAAASFLDESHLVAREIGARPLEALALGSLATLATAEADFEQAQTRLTEALRLWREIEDDAGTAAAMRGLGEIAAARGQLDRAVVLLAASEALRDQVGAAIAPSRRERYEDAVATVRRGLGEKAFAASWATGRALEPQAVYELAVSSSRPPRRQAAGSTSPA